MGHSHAPAHFSGIADATQAIKINKREAYAYWMRGLAYDDKGDKKRALADLRQALKLARAAKDAETQRQIQFDLELVLID